MTSRQPRQALFRPQDLDAAKKEKLEETAAQQQRRLDADATSATLEEVRELRDAAARDRAATARDLEEMKSQLKAEKEEAARDRQSAWSHREDSRRYLLEAEQYHVAATEVLQRAASHHDYVVKVVDGRLGYVQGLVEEARYHADRASGEVARASGEVTRASEVLRDAGKEREALKSMMATQQNPVAASTSATASPGLEALQELMEKRMDMEKAHTASMFKMFQKLVKELNEAVFPDEDH